MTTFFLVRHAVHDLVDRNLVGRMPDVHLNVAGRRQACRAAERLVCCGITAIQSSPQTRARETAAPIGERLGLPVRLAFGMDEMDMGRWTGRSFAQLQADPLWNLWNAARGIAQPPGGESAGQLQRRVVEHLARAAAADPAGRVAVVSHAEPIRAVLLHAFGLPLDDWWRLDIQPGEIRMVAFDGRKFVSSECGEGRPDRAARAAAAGRPDRGA